MSLFDTDKTGADRGAPAPNHDDKKIEYSAKRTVAGGDNGNIGFGTVIDKNLADSTITPQQISLVSVSGPRAYVSTTGDNGDYTDIQTAIDYVEGVGGGIVFIRNGTYTIPNDITLYSNITLEGETAGGVILVFTGPYSIKATGTSSYTTGTISISSGSSTVTGSGTSWSTNLTTSHMIKMNGLAYTINSVDSDTSLTLSSPYYGPTLSGASYQAAVYVKQASLINLTIIASASSAIIFDYTYEPIMTDITIPTPGTSGVVITNSAQPVLDTIVVIGAGSTGISETNTDLITHTRCAVFGSTSHGIITNNCTGMVFTSCPMEGNGGDGYNITDGENYSWQICLASNNTGNGFSIAGSMAGGSITGASENNGGDGIKLAGTVTSMVIGPFCTLSGNTGYGVNVSASGVTNTSIIGCQFSSNTAGALTDSGTGTIKRNNLPDNTTNNDFILDTDTSLAADSDLRIATQKAVKAYADSIAGFPDPTTTKGDLIVHGSSTTRLGVGADGQVLTADSAQTDGIKWASVAGGGDMSTSTYDPAGIAEQLVGLTASQSPTNKTFDSTSPTAFFYPGFIQACAMRTAPTGWLNADGTTISRSTYSGLFAAIVPSLGTFTVTIASPAVVSKTAHGLATGDQIYFTTTGALPTGLTANTLFYVIRDIDANSFHVANTRANAYAGTAINTSGSQSGTHTLWDCPYGLGDGSTTFTLPDFRGRVLAGLDRNGSSAAGLLTLLNSEGVYGNLGAPGGEQSHTLTVPEMAQHNHAKSTSLANAPAGTGPYVIGTGNNTQGMTAGGGGAGNGSHNNVQPTRLVNYIIKT